MTVRFIGIFTLLLAAVFTGCGRKATEESPIAQPLDSIFSAMFPPNEPGAVVMVMKGDSIVYSRGFGLARLDKPTPMSDSTLINICSASKTYLTVAIMKLVEEGRVKLDTPITAYLKDYPPIFDKITLRHILTHSSGLPDLRPKNDEEWSEFSSRVTTPFANARDYMLYSREPSMVAVFSNLDSLEYEPGNEFKYQELPYLLAPFVIRGAIGEMYGEYVKREIFDKAGLNETFYYIPGIDSDRMAHGYAPINPDVESPVGVFRSRDRKWVEADYGEIEFFASRADRGVYASPRDFMKWVRTVFDGNIIKKETLAEINTLQIPSGLPNIGYGLGVYIAEVPGRARKSFHSISNGGFAAYEGIFPDHDLCYLIFANRPDWERIKTATKVDSLLRVYGLFDNPEPQL